MFWCTYKISDKIIPLNTYIYTKIHQITISFYDYLIYKLNQKMLLTINVFIFSKKVINTVCNVNVFALFLDLLDNGPPDPYIDPSVVVQLLWQRQPQLG